MKKTGVLLFIILVFLTACRSVETVFVHFDSKGGEDIESIEIQKGSTIELPGPHKEGFTFTGWYLDQAKVEAFVEGTVIDVSITVYAGWDRNAYTISFETEGGTEIEDRHVLYEDPIMPPDDPVKTGHTFLGWFLDEDKTEPYVFSMMPAHHMMIYAGWEVNHYTVTYVDFEQRMPVVVTAGWSHTGILTDCGHVYMWGDNEYGQIGDGTTEAAYSPIDITDRFGLEEGETVVALSSGGYNNIALTSENRVFTWGANIHGQLGIGSTEQQSTPVDITNQFTFDEGETIIEIRTSMSHMMILTSEGRVYAWGRNNDGYVGDGSRIQRSTPVEITTFFNLDDHDKIIFINAAANSVAISETGRIFAWGWNWYGQLGDDSTTDRYAPVEITDQFDLQDSETIILITVGDSHAAALTSSGQVYTWGWNNQGQLGDGTNTNRRVPTNITHQIILDENEIITDVFTGSRHTVLVSNRGRVLVFGSNNLGQLGLDETVPEVNVPTNITLRFDFVYGETIVQGDAFLHNIVLTSENRLFSWGFNEQGQIVGDISETENEPVLLNGVLVLTIIHEEEIPFDSVIDSHLAEREGHEFDGWYLDPGLSEMSTYSKMPAYDLVLYASWVKSKEE